MTAPISKVNRMSNSDNQCERSSVNCVVPQIPIKPHHRSSWHAPRSSQSAPRRRGGCVAHSRCRAAGNAFRSYPGRPAYRRPPKRTAQSIERGRPDSRQTRRRRRTDLPGHIYVAPPDRHMIVSGGRLRLLRAPRKTGRGPPSTRCSAAWPKAMVPTPLAWY